MVKIFSEVKGKHHFQINDTTIYTLEFPSTESLGARYSAALLIADELFKALENEKKTAEEKKAEAQKLAESCEKTTVCENC